ncbi:transglycosylase domain-containing protein [Bradyrhizobium barranii]|uniref:transglycosylase domain-containing protein n=1 Tax=Bradyrhizobium TaxID=374 RepID=UPI003F292DAB
MELMRRARLLRGSLRCAILEPLSETLTFGFMSLLLFLILANPVLHKTGNLGWSESSDRAVDLPVCRTGLTTACGKYSTPSVQELPDVLVMGTLAAGDRRFYSHFGIDLGAIALSLHAGPDTNPLRPSIGQQVARLLVPFDQHSADAWFHEALVAIWLEWRLSKDEILNIYLNRVQIGADIFGVSEAAQNYFQKQVQDIELSEAALLAGLINAPPVPYSHVALSNARERANRVLDMLLESGIITNDQAFAAKERPARLILRK